MYNVTGTTNLYRNRAPFYLKIMIWKRIGEKELSLIAGIMFMFYSVQTLKVANCSS